ncbi:hypothetical protein OUZ56_024605 [Daphnia magna]|uniref:Uncharacterized protein n=2 Tax=Daphnia magna TaxID=35525 RepID=A0ABR0B1B5_9CRUS|nr:hypothetical protein OUZ56_024605 [Daphnia magna]
MARTSENDEQESDSAGGVQEKWPITDGIKQEILIDLDQSSSSIVEKDWSFIPAVPAQISVATMKLFSKLFSLGLTFLILSTKKKLKSFWIARQGINSFEFQ